MAITNAQQYQQLVNPPMKGNKRPGYRGDAAARSTGADQSQRADPESRGDPGEGVNRAGFSAPTKDEPAFTSRDRFVTVDPDSVAENRRIVQESTGIAALDRLEKEGVKQFKFPGMFSTALNILTPVRNIGLRKNIDYFKKNFEGPFTLENYKQFMADRMDQVTSEGNDDNNPFIPVDTTFNMASNDMDQGTETETEIEEPFQLSRRFAAGGGIMNTNVVGGEMDFESARQMYGLGKLVKKVTRSVKKIAKSPIGKAALLYTVGGGLGSLAKGQGFFSSFMSPMNQIRGMGSIFSRSGLQNIGSKIGLGSFENVGSNRIFQKNLLGKVLTSPAGIIAGTSLIAGALTAQQEEEAQQIADETGIDIAEIRANPNKYLARRFRAEGGSMDEPVAKKTMPLLDMDGKEMDLRAEGGFVPIGRMEKADDVPARLSKNEFVFTADAVRNAGEGDVDKGAEVMYNMMKNLESGGEVSEESQGLEGARKMFQTSQRLEEVL